MGYVKKKFLVRSLAILAMTKGGIGNDFRYVTGAYRDLWVSFKWMILSRALLFRTGYLTIKK